MNRIIDVLTLYAVENGMITWYVDRYVRSHARTDCDFSVATSLSLFFVSGVRALCKIAEVLIVITLRSGSSCEATLHSWGCI